MSAVVLPQAPASGPPGPPSASQKRAQQPLLVEAWSVLLFQLGQ